MLLPGEGKRRRHEERHVDTERVRGGWDELGD